MNCVTLSRCSNFCRRQSMFCRPRINTSPCRCRNTPPRGTERNKREKRQEASTTRLGNVQTPGARVPPIWSTPSGFLVGAWAFARCAAGAKPPNPRGLPQRRQVARNQLEFTIWFTAGLCGKGGKPFYFDCPYFEDSWPHWLRLR